MDIIIFWIAVIVFSVVIEAITAQLVSIWFAVGGLAALIAAVLKAPVYVQGIVFFVVSGVILVVFLSLRKKLFSPLKIEKTNYDRIIGKEALVIKDIDMLLGNGQVKVMGQVWTALPEKEDEKIYKDEKVEVVGIKGVKAVVRKNIDNKNKGDKEK